MDKLRIFPVGQPLGRTLAQEIERLDSGYHDKVARSLVKQFLQKLQFRKIRLTVFQIEVKMI